jgi:hypothetical protein
MTTAVARGFTAVMAARREPPDALDFFPTPLWATRALFRHVLPALGVETVGRVWEPACGEGHMAEVINEFAGLPVIATDIFDYGYGSAPYDFLGGIFSAPLIEQVDWIITNPPFKPAEQFALRALDFARVGVALLLPIQWVEGEDRYFSLFRDRPPTLIAPFVERVPMVKGRWDPDASTATCYAWFVWVRDTARAPFWIPPGCRTALTRADDRQRFAAWTLSPSGASLFPAPLDDRCDKSTEGGRS